VTARRVRAFIGLGSNLGDRLGHLEEAVRRLAGIEGVDVARTSRVYETTPVGPDQPDFLNAVAEVFTSLPARELLKACLAIEDEMGRVRMQRWGPRVIDLDLLTYDTEEIDEPDLIVPHPRMLERAFVLVPMLELEPHPPLPRGAKIERPGPSRAAEEEVRPFAPPLDVT
jgi:2-amino-4-hydroxy-6-hydroxymethyldihydropteridine diphosphokinase